MTEKPKPESSEDDAEFERVLRNLVNTPHKPHQAGKQPVKLAPRWKNLPKVGLRSRPAEHLLALS